MAQIEVIEKPDWVSYELIHTVLWKSHESNRKNGIDFRSAHLSARELEKSVEKNGKCYVALDGTTVVGTISVGKIHCDYWCLHGNIARLKYLAVLPEYRGKHVASLLIQKVEDFAIKENLPAIDLHTAERQTDAIRIYEKKGFKLIGFTAFPSALDHYSVEMIKWIDEDPYSDIIRRIRFCVRKAYIKIRYKTGKIKRFGI